ncbi:hypothetical protein HAX54_011955 [Datura stramonium]|uniref:Uncharacterized protein n=1 Tax=Datura stramonium TaxID=4076 RepID=A0ABS8TJ05_DATST|nr:hypothetical protein [Datura stramonium]
MESKRARIPSEEENEDVSMAPPPLRRNGLCWVTERKRMLLEEDGVTEEQLQRLNIDYPRVKGTCKPSCGVGLDDEPLDDDVVCGGRDRKSRLGHRVY